MKLDNFDRKILREFQRDTRQTAADLAKIVGLSPSACHRRLTALRQAGVIQAEVAIIHPESVGRGVTLIVAVTLEREHTDVIANFKRETRGSIEIMQCYYVTGTADFIMILTSKSMESYDAFVEHAMCPRVLDDANLCVNCQRPTGQDSRSQRIHECGDVNCVNS